MPAEKDGYSLKDSLSVLALIIAICYLVGCAGIPVSQISSPRSGLVLFINGNEWAEGEVMVFRPEVRQGNLFDVSNSGAFILKSRPIVSIPIAAAPATNIPSVISAQLNPDQAYSVVTLWQNKVGQFINFTYGSVRTSESGLNEIYTDLLGRQFYADRVVYLPTVAAWEAKPYRVKLIVPR
jgi:hypothetical protein